MELSIDKKYFGSILTVRVDLSQTKAEGERFREGKWTSLLPSELKCPSLTSRTIGWSEKIIKWTVVFPGSCAFNNESVTSQDKYL